MTTNNAINLTDAGLANYDGAGTFTGVTLTQHSPLVGGASNAITSLGPLTNGQLVVGSTGVDPVAATITAGTGISIANGAGTITISTIGSGFTWSTTSTNITNMSANNGYFCISPGGALTLGLPATSVVGDALIINLSGATSFQITQAAGQQINLGNQATTVGATGTLTSTGSNGDSISIVCSVANTIWDTVASIGNFTLA